MQAFCRIGTSMYVILFVDNRYGMLFNHRRLSRDRGLMQKVAVLTQGALLWTDAFSAPLFPERPENLRISENFLEEAGEGAFCLDEDRPLLPYGEKIERLYLFCWNRDYPSDVKLDFLPWEHGLVPVSEEEFAGSSHEKITLQLWEREEDSVPMGDADWEA
ncbi:MAG: ribonuclease Z [Lachnospiraceae bacterium]|nr:ribonuclease Z [Lachnospiraceae bacterium]